MAKKKEEEVKKEGEKGEEATVYESHNDYDPA